MDHHQRVDTHKALHTVADPEPAVPAVVDAVVEPEIAPQPEPPVIIDEAVIVPDESIVADADPVDTIEDAVVEGGAVETKESALERTASQRSRLSRGSRISLRATVPTIEILHTSMDDNQVPHESNASLISSTSVSVVETNDPRLEDMSEVGVAQSTTQSTIGRVAGHDDVTTRGRSGSMTDARTRTAPHTRGSSVDKPTVAFTDATKPGGAKRVDYGRKRLVSTFHFPNRFPSTD